MISIIFIIYATCILLSEYRIIRRDCILIRLSLLFNLLIIIFYLSRFADIILKAIISS